MRSSQFLLLLLAISGIALAGAGCARLASLAPKHSKSSRQKRALVASAPALTEVGTVMLVDEPRRFVLVDHGMLPVAPAGGVLKTFTNGVESGELLATEVKRGSFTIANIRTGAPQKGDRVFFVPPTWQKNPAAGNGSAAPQSTPSPQTSAPPMKLPGEGPLPTQPSPAAALDQ